MEVAEDKQIDEREVSEKPEEDEFGAEEDFIIEDKLEEEDQTQAKIVRKLLAG